MGKEKKKAVKTAKPTNLKITSKRRQVALLWDESIYQCKRYVNHKDDHEHVYSDVRVPGHGRP